MVEWFGALSTRGVYGLDNRLHDGWLELGERKALAHAGDNSINTSEDNGVLPAASCSASGISWWRRIMNWFEKRRKEKEEWVDLEKRIDDNYKDAVLFFQDLNVWLDEHAHLAVDPKDSDTYIAELNKFTATRSHTAQHNNR